MKTPAALALLAGLSVAGAVLLNGAAPFGRVALALGLPRVAGTFFSDPAWRGAAAFEAGAYAEAAEAFARVEGYDYQLGVALARDGRYAAALEAFDRAMAADPEDAWARANFDLVSSVYAGTAISFDAAFARVERGEGPTLAAEIGQGGSRATGTGDEVTNAGTALEAPQLTSDGARRISKIFDDRFMRADERWLANLSDVPGDFLAARIYEERKRRIKAGLSQPEPEDPQ